MNDNLQPVFRALSDSTRRGILRELSMQDLTIVELVSKSNLSRNAVRKHLTILEEGNLINAYGQGRARMNSLNAKALKDAFDWLSYFENFWGTALQDLKTAVEKEEG